MSPFLQLRIPAFLPQVSWAAISAILLAVLLGLVASTGNVMLAALISGALGALVLITHPTVVLWVATLVTLVVAGVIKYFIPTLDRIWWLAYGIAFLLYLPTMLYLVSRQTEHHGRATGSSLIMGAVVLLLLDIVMTTIIARPSPWQIVVAAKSLLMFGGVWAYLAFVPVETDTIWKWLKGLLLIALLQWLPALYQFLFVRAARQEQGLGTVSAADSVVGTFGGSMESGGLTAVLAFFLIAALVCVTAMRREGVMNRSRYLLYSVLLIFPLLMMEVKVIFVYLPLAMLILLRKEIISRPHIFFGWMSIGTVLLAGLLAGYQVLHWSTRGTDWEDRMVQAFSYSFQEQAGPQAAEKGTMTRRESLEFWWRQHARFNIPQLLIGHGLGASRTQGLVQGNIATKYSPLHIDRTGLAQLLWDIGIIGVLAMIALLFFAYLRAGRLAASQRLLPWQRALARGIQAILPLYVLSLGYRNDIPYAAPMMFTVMATFGLVAWMGKQDGEQLPGRIGT